MAEMKTDAGAGERWHDWKRLHDKDQETIAALEHENEMLRTAVKGLHVDDEYVLSVLNHIAALEQQLREARAHIDALKAALLEASYGPNFGDEHCWCYEDYCIQLGPSPGGHSNRCNHIREALTAAPAPPTEVSDARA